MPQPNATRHSVGVNSVSGVLGSLLLNVVETERGVAGDEREVGGGRLYGKDQHHLVSIVGGDEQHVIRPERGHEADKLGDRSRPAREFDRLAIGL